VRRPPFSSTCGHRCEAVAANTQLHDVNVSSQVRAFARTPTLGLSVRIVNWSWLTSKATMACTKCRIRVKSAAAELLPCSQFAVSRTAYCITYSTVALMLLPDWQPGSPDAEFPYIYMGVPAGTGMLRTFES
jgi:hypothetical protein